MVFSNWLLMYLTDSEVQTLANNMLRYGPINCIYCHCYFLCTDGLNQVDISSFESHVLDLVEISNLVIIQHSTVALV